MSYTVKKSSDRTLREISQFGVRSSNIAPKAVESEHIAEQAVQTQHVQDKAITGVKIAEASIDEAHIKDAAITAAKIQDAAITSAKIGDLSADKIKAGVLTVTDQVGAGASGIIVKSGTAERVRLDKNGITVNEGNIIVRSPTGATMISAQGINVNEFTENVMRGFNLVRNPFWIDRRREYKTRWIQTYSDKNHLFSGSPASRALHQIIPATVDGKEYIYVFYTRYTGIVDQPAVCRYYPPTATWETMSKIPNYNLDRYWFSIQKSSDNKVYLFGGIKNGAITNECWEYDLDTDSWQQKAPMPKGLNRIVSLLVGNKIYVFGGFDSTGTWNRYCYIYDITTNSWAQGWQIPYEDHYSVAYYGGYIYVFCLLAKRILKYTTSGSLVSNETYDKDVPYYNANCVYGSKIYFVGGVKELVDGNVTDHADSCISYDFDTKTFEDLANLPFKIHFTSVCVVTKLGSNTYDGVSEFPRLYIIGGYTKPMVETTAGVALKEVYMLPLYSGETDSEGYYFDDWKISKDDSRLQVVWKPAGTKGNGRITIANPNRLYSKRVILSQFVDLSKIDTSSPYTLSSYSKTGVAWQHLSSRIGDKSFVDSIYSLIEEGFIERTFENLPNEGEYLLEICIQMFRSREDHLSWFYGIQLEKGKMSSGIVAPHLEDLGLPLGSIRPEHLYESAIPPGAIMPFARPTAPAGWLVCDGRAVNRIQYKNLFDAIGTTFGAGDGSTTFNLPDLRGEFIRGWDNGRGVDPGRQFGSWQEDALQNITGSITVNPTSSIQFLTDGGQSSIITEGALGITSYSKKMSIDNGPTTTLYPDGIFFDASRSARTASETRPRNVALLYCIKY